jgi:glycosyltransferase involved in cell wall biosynthesis
VLVIASMTTGHPSHLSGHVRAALAHAHATHAHVAVLNLGTRAPDITDLGTSMEILTPGPLPEAELARLLAAADVFLAPYSDGVSTRRGSMMAALQHGVPVVATSGRLTDRLLFDNPEAVLLNPVTDIESFALGVNRALVGHDQRRRAARQLYSDRFDWPVVARRMLDDLAM